MMLTHLTYFGYCFNPVIFYYVFNTSDKETSDVGRKRTNSRSGSGKKINNSDIDAYDSSINVSEIDGLFIEVPILLTHLQMILIIAILIMRAILGQQYAMD